ncbi:MAG: glycine dehydrogenase (aminomethyl-transferring) [Proteobacteria bacterium]|nr:MAG: glycine dehydrogenase (aminomethyl-transferring) [Pseudomonadota bacterium]
MELEQHGDFVRRHIGPDADDVAAMLAELQLSSLDELVDLAVPASIRTERPLEIPGPRSERGTGTYLRRMRHRNRVFVSMIGAGYHGTVMPPVIRRNVLENPDWYTAYTPYQAEVSQGRLEVLLNFQQMVIDLTGMELANASLLDEATAAAEAMAMSRRLSKSGSNRFFVAVDCHPQTLAVVSTRAESMGLEIVTGDPAKDAATEDYFGMLLQYPSSTGAVSDPRKAIESAHSKGALVTVAADILALALLTPPGEMGADIVVGSTQRFGVPMGYGGPHAAFFATREQYKRSTPGRIIGVSQDSQGRRALRMALQTREQHIRRDKATSNICTAQVLLAVLSALYAMYHGELGIRTIAQRVHRMARIFAAGIKRNGYTVVNRHYFDTVMIHVPGLAGRIAAKARESNINLRVVDPDHVCVSFDETTRRETVVALWGVFSTKSPGKLDIDTLDRSVGDAIPIGLKRKSRFLTNEIFSLYHSETEMMRYLRRLAGKDITLGRSMIPLGSCTMKLNATSELLPLGFRDFTALHPFAPLDQTQGYQQLFEELEEMLCEVTGFDAISLQPNAGSQGEYAGLLCIRAWHRANGQANRNVCLIPSSAHGTNPASAVMAGMKVVVVGCDQDGNIDVDQLRETAAKHGDDLAALMVTYPSTHGVFEEAIREICDIIHKAGGQVYMDGANLNALVGLCRPAEIGADVAHINLHKTFAIPHGGGGPGMGPIGVKSHLARFLPDHPMVDGVNPAAGGQATIGSVSAAPWGSASILPISWAYMTMMGGDGLRHATEVAILNANYIAYRLNPYYPVVYKGKNGLVAHECIIDLSQFKDSSGITVEDVAKRLVDYGFHAPTMSWPVHDSLMIEPTESESKQELDRFCNAMISIREEISKVESGEFDREDNPLRNAPHAYHLLVGDEWGHKYRRETAFFPSPHSKMDKYWPPVGRVDNVYGDKHLVCTCPPIEAYQ